MSVVPPENRFNGRALAFSLTDPEQATTQLETRKNRDINDTLSRRKEEIAELNRMMQHQTIEISNLQADAPDSPSPLTSSLRP